MWEIYFITGLFVISLFLLIIQSIKVYLWKDRYRELVKSIKLGAEIHGQTKESNSRGNSEEENN